MWGYLSEFWNSVASTTLNAWEYTESWFYSVGNAVAGAIGNLFYSTLHYLNDTWVFLGWVFSVIGQVISLFLLPLTYVFQFLKGLVGQVFASPSDFSYTWSSEVLAVFDNIPYWDTISAVLGACIIVIAVIFVLRQFTKL